MARKKKPKRDALDILIELYGDTVSREELARLVEEGRKRDAIQAEAMKKPADWVEPSITIEQAEADPFNVILADLMRRHELKVVTRSQYFAMEYGNAVPRPWTAELESTLPLELQDRYMTVPRRLKRVNLEPDNQ